jgi:ATP-dependent helicase/nuclease subunit A
MADLAAAGAAPEATQTSNALADEFIVVQGVVDLAVILPTELWLVDFKTDKFKAGELADRVKSHELQMKLYALALQRIYQRPVTECCLYFLSLQQAVSLFPRFQR